MRRKEPSGKGSVNRMADISREIQAFRNAIYGEEVRGSMISLAEKVNKESTDAKTASAQSAESAAASVQLANIAVGRADTAAENADAAAQNIQDRADRGDFTSTVQIGSVTTGAAGTEASVSNSGTDKDVVLNFTIPRGDKGVSMYMAGAWNSGTEYVNSVSRIDIVTCNGSTYGCRQTHTSSQDNAPAGEENEYWLCLARKGDTGNIENIDTIPIAFSEAAEPENLESGDSVTTVFGKIKKWFSDLSNGAASTLLGNNLQEGKVLVSDETGKVTNSEITSDTLSYLDGLEGNVQGIFENLAIEISKKQNSLNIAHNSIPNLDSFWEGLMWYNASQNLEGTKPFDNYGFILAFSTGVNHIQIGIPFGGAVSENLRVRSYADKRWYDWKSISRRHVNFNVTPNPSFGGTVAAQGCYINLETSEVHIFFTVNNMTGLTGAATPIVTIPEAYRPLANKPGIGIVKIGSAYYTAFGVVRTDGSITQSISSVSEIKEFTFMADYWISN